MPQTGQVKITPYLMERARTELQHVLAIFSNTGIDYEHLPNHVRAVIDRVNFAVQDCNHEISRLVLQEARRKQTM